MFVQSREVAFKAGLSGPTTGEMSLRSAFLSAVLSLALLAPATAHGSAHISVVGGRSLDVPDYMAFVVAQTSGTGVNLCGGTAIRPNVLLTAAHCVVDHSGDSFVPAEGLHMIFGVDDPWGAIKSANDPVPSDGVAEYVTAHYGVHRNGAAVNDIALLRLRDRAPATVRVLPAGRAAIATAGRPSVVIGWGTETGNGNTNSSSLRRADLTIQRSGYCGSFFREFDASIMLCAQGRGQSACHGDSGGPLLVADGARKIYVAGVVSFGAPGCPATVPGYFANVARGPLARFVSTQAARLQKKADAEATAAKPLPEPVEGAVPLSR